MTTSRRSRSGARGVLAGWMLLGAVAVVGCYSWEAGGSGESGEGGDAPKPDPNDGVTSTTTTTSVSTSTSTTAGSGGGAGGQDESSSSSSTAVSSSSSGAGGDDGGCVSGGTCFGCIECSAKGSCKDVVDACKADPACAVVIDCWKGCSSSACQAGCMFQGPEDNPQFLELGECVICDTCSIECDLLVSLVQYP